MRCSWGDAPTRASRRSGPPARKDIVQYGFGQLSFTMLEHGLLDELRLWVSPLFVGKADPTELPYRHGPSAIFAPTDTTMLDNGSVILGKLFDRMTQPDLGGGPVDERGGALPLLEGKGKQSGYDRSAARCRVAEPQGSRRGPTGGGASR